MAQFELEDLVEPLTPEQVQTTVEQTLDVVGVSATVWKADAVTRTLVAVFSFVMSFVTVLIAGIAQSGFLKYARGNYLTILARYTYRQERESATFAQGAVTLTNASATPYSLAVGDLVVSNPSTGQSYSNTAATTVAASTTTSALISATEIGSASSALADTITEITTPLLGVTCTNPQALVGLDEESDESLISKCLTAQGALSPFGPADAYRYFATTATRDNGSSCGVTRVRLVKDGEGTVTVYCAGPSNVIAGDDIDIVDDRLQRNATPLCVTLETASCDVTLVSVTYTAYVYSDVTLTEAQLKSAIAQQLSARIARLPIGGDNGTLYLESIRAAIVAADPTHIFNVTLAAPGSDVTLDIDTIAVINTVTGTIVYEPPPEGSVHA